MKTAILIPVYNNDWVIASLIDRIRLFAKPEDIIVVNDGSSDRTQEILARISDIKVIFHKENMGKGKALESGFNAALSQGYEWIITVDGDGQHSVEDLPLFLSSQSGDIIIGRREFCLAKMPFLRILSNKITSFILTRLTGQKIHDSQSGYRKIRADVLRQIKVQSGRFQYESELLILASKRGFKISHVPIKTLYNSQRSSMRHFKDTWEFVKMVFRYI